MERIKNARGNSPSWLTPDELEQAQALIDLGFGYLGLSKNYSTFEEWEVKPLATVGGWKIGFSSGECGIDVIFKDALFFYWLEEKDQALKIVKQAKKAIQQVIKEQNSRVIQLSLLTLLEA